MIKKADVRVSNEGSIFLVHPLTNAGVKALDTIFENSEGAQFFGNALVVEHHYILSIVDALREDFGLAVI